MRFPRKYLSCFLLFFFLPGCQPAFTPQTTPPPSSLTFFSQREYRVHQRLTLVNMGPGQPEKQNLWVALIHSVSPYQEVLSLKITPEKYKVIVDEVDNQYAEFDFSDHPPGETFVVEIDYQVMVNELSYDLSTCEGEIPGEFIQPELHIESANPQITGLASELSRSKKTACQKIRAFYDYIGDKLIYTFNGANWGAQAALGTMGADCTEYTSLLIALSRAQGVPARYFTGLLYLDEKTDPVARIEHAWPDVYLPPAGWVGLDPTLGRLPVRRDAYFAHYTPDHIIVTLGVNPSVMRGSNYWTHLYWPGDSTKIKVSGEWEIERVEKEKY